tara:strand:- start:637 stop:1767 length:1131 start_codon:yes stop_codon:yes gene_type:complete
LVTVFALAALSLLATASCAPKQTAITASSETSQADKPQKKAPWEFTRKSGALYSASCPADEEFLAPEGIAIESRKVPGEGAGAFESLPGVEIAGLTFIAGYHLTSSDPRFGGLSGIAAPHWGQLLTISDQGDFVWLTLDEQTATAPLQASIATMRGADGQPLSGKQDGDAEGLALRDGLALVSFERNHRIEAFDLASCGAAARAAPVLSLDDALDMPRISENGGPEALALSPNGGLVIGLETPRKGMAPLSLAPENSAAAFKRSLPQADGFRLTGMDFYSSYDGTGMLYSLHRAFNPLTGPRIILQATPAEHFVEGWLLGETRSLLRLNLPAPVDNFEGIAALRTPEGKTRLYIISDDNFSKSQRTLLYIFEVTGS